MVLRKDQLEAKLRDEAQMIENGTLKDENPLDDSEEFYRLTEACRQGDLRTCQELISAGVNINGRDRFDYTPLILASLCGHYELVELLLESGALAERNTFQGERCVYNALNNKIRDLLLQYDFSKSTDPLQPWASYITSLPARHTPRTSDISVHAEHSPHQSFDLHKFLVSARSPYFRRKLAAAPDTKTWRLPASIPVESFRVVMKFLYLDDIPRGDLVEPGGFVTEEDVLAGVDRVSRDLEIERLWESMLAVNDARLARQRYQDEVNRANEQMDEFFRRAVLGERIVVERAGLEGVRWARENHVFADCLVAAYYPEPASQENGNGKETHPTEPSTAVPAGSLSQASPGGSASQKVAVYPVHKAMLIRSPYFETMFSNPFKESQESEHLHIVTMDCSPDVLEIVLSFIYTDRVQCPLDLALDLLYTADMLFLDRLKTKAATVISTLGSGNANLLVDRTHTDQTLKRGGGEEVEVEPINIYDVIHAAWDLRVQRLEEFAARYLAYRLEDYIDDDEFADLIKQSAGRIQEREETDTIELLDDIRYYLSDRFRLRFEDAGLEDMMDEKGGVDVSLAEAMEKTSLAAGEGVENGEGKPDGESREEARDGEAGAEKGAEKGAIQTLDGNVVTDEFDSDAINYQVLLNKIDAMLERLELGA